MFGGLYVPPALVLVYDVWGWGGFDKNFRGPILYLADRRKTINGETLILASNPNFTQTTKIVSSRPIPAFLPKRWKIGAIGRSAKVFISGRGGG